MTRYFAILLLAGALRAETFYLTVAGLGGEADYEKRFAQYAQDLQKATAGEALSGPKATKAALKAALERIAAAAKPEDTFVLTLIGHGTYDGLVYKFNVPGEDVTAEELRLWLDRIPARQFVAVLTSASGAALETLRRENRVVVTATRSGNEKNAVVISRYWVEALRDGAGDTDKNDIVTALEAFKFADQKTAKFFETANRIATEHALLEDTGKAAGVRTPGPDNGEGLLAARLALLKLGPAQAAYRDPAKQELLKKKEALEEKIDQLKYEKAAMPVDEYKRQLQRLLLELAATQEAIDK
jgi:hypothetical protein